MALGTQATQNRLPASTEVEPRVSRCNSSCRLFWMLFSLCVGVILPQRITQLYPLPSTTTPLTFSQPVHNGRYSQTGDVYIHYPNGAAGTNIRIIQKDGSLMYDLAQTGSNVEDTLIYGDSVYAFGVTSGIMQYTLAYSLPAYMTYTATFLPSHNLNLLRTSSLPSSSLVLVTTSTGGALHKFDLAALTTPASVTVPLFSSGTMDGLAQLPNNQVILGGQPAGFVIVLWTTMTVSQTLTGSSMIGNICYDNLNSYAQTFVDYSENTAKSLNRATVGAGVLTIVTSVSSAATIDNLVPMGIIGYLLTTSGTSLNVYRRSSLTLIESFTLSGVVSPNSIALSGGAAPTHKFVISSALVQTTPTSQTVFSTYEINLNYCASFSGTTCIVCYAGFQASSTTAGNRCLMPEEYPPMYGATGRTIAPCRDPNCAACAASFDECTQCQTGTYLNTITSACQMLSQPSLVGVDPASPQTLKLCQDFSCLNCAQNYLLCQSCPIEVFSLANGVCVSKPASIEVVSIRFEEEFPAMVVEFSQPVTSRPESFYPVNLTFSVKDYKGDNYTYLDNTTLAMEAGGTRLRVSFNLWASIYNATITLTQESDTPLFYKLECVPPKHTLESH